MTRREKSPTWKLLLRFWNASALQVVPANELLSIPHNSQIAHEIALYARKQAKASFYTNFISSWLNWWRDTCTPKNSRRTMSNVDSHPSPEDAFKSLHNPRVTGTSGFPPCNSPRDASQDRVMQRICSESNEFAASSWSWTEIQLEPQSVTILLWQKKQWRFVGLRARILSNLSMGRGGQLLHCRQRGRLVGGQLQYFEVDVDFEKRR